MVDYYDQEVKMGNRELANLLSGVSEIRKLHDNGAAAHFGYIALIGNGLYEVGTLVLDAVDDSMIAFHRENYHSLTDARTALRFRVDRGY
jgi:hypothetical protein